MSEPWMFEMSKHSMRRGSSSRSSRSRSARRISCDWRRGCFHSRSKASLRVADHELEQPHLLAALRRADPHLGAPPLADSHGSSSSRSRDLLGHQDLARHVAARRRRTAGWSWARTPSGSVSRSSRKPSRATTLPSRTAKTWTAARSPSTCTPEEVALLELGGGDLLRRLQPLQGAHLVAQAAGLLEAILGRRLLHLAAQPPHHLVGAALEEEPRVLAGLPIALERADLGHAGRDAALDLVLQAGPRRAVR